MFEHNRLTVHLKSDTLKYISLWRFKGCFDIWKVQQRQNQLILIFYQENGATTDKDHARLA